MKSTPDSDLDDVDRYLASLPERPPREGLYDSRSWTVPNTPMDRNLWLICAALQASDFFAEEGDVAAAVSRLHVVADAIAERQCLLKASQPS
jgi:hypothetical protein